MTGQLRFPPDFIMHPVLKVPIRAMHRRVGSAGVNGVLFGFLILWYLSFQLGGWIIAEQVIRKSRATCQSIPFIMHGPRSPIEQYDMCLRGIQEALIHRNAAGDAALLATICIVALFIVIVKLSFFAAILSRIIRRHRSSGQ